MDRDEIVADLEEMSLASSQYSSVDHYIEVNNGDYVRGNLAWLWDRADNPCARRNG